MQSKDSEGFGSLHTTPVRSGRIRLGIIGCGAITVNSHLPAALSSQLVEITILCDNNLSRLRYIEREHGLKGIGSTDHRDAFSKVDAVILALPNHLHASIGSEFLSRGIHVLCEKPLATSSGECAQLCSIARSASSVLAVGYVKRFFPSTSITKQLLDSDFLGNVMSFDYEFGTAGGWAPSSGYNLKRSTAGGGVLVTSGSHFLNRLLYLFGRPDVIGYADDNYGGVEANCSAVFECTLRGVHVRGEMTLSKTHKLSNRLRVLGEKGSIEIGEGQHHSVTYFPRGRGLKYEIFEDNLGKSKKEEEDNYFRVQLEDFVEAIQTGRKPRVDGEEASICVAITEKCYEIARPLDLPWVDATLHHFKEAIPFELPRDQAYSRHR